MVDLNVIHGTMEEHILFVYELILCLNKAYVMCVCIYVTVWVYKKITNKNTACVLLSFEVQ